LEILVAYCSLQGAEPGVDPGFGVEVTWDIPLLDGYAWVHVPNRSLRPGLGRFFGLFNPGLWKLVRTGGFDAVVSYTGYAYASSWITTAAAKVSGTPLLFGTDATTLLPRDGKRWKLWVKRFLLPAVFRLADTAIAPSTAAKEMIHKLGIPEDQVVLTPFTVDNDWWTKHAARVDRDCVRGEWGVPLDAPVVLFCGKLQPWKRPQDVLRAFAKLTVPGAHLVVAGDGPLRAELETEARELAVVDGCAFWVSPTSRSCRPFMPQRTYSFSLPNMILVRSWCAKRCFAVAQPLSVTRFLGGWTSCAMGRPGSSIPVGMSMPCPRSWATCSRTRGAYRESEKRHAREWRPGRRAKPSRQP